MTASNQQTLEAKLVDVVAAVAGVKPNVIKTDEPFERYGINSTMIVELSDVLSEEIPNISTSVFFEFRTITDLAAHLVSEGAADDVEPRVPDVPAPVVEATPTVTDDENWLDAWLPDTSPAVVAPHVPSTQDIAIVAMSGRYPKAPNLAAFWDNLTAGRDCVTEVPQDRWDVTDWYDADPEREDRVYSKWGGFLDGIDQFDARFFNVSPREAKRMDPQERVFLQEAWHCFETAGLAKSDLRGSRTGVFVGAMWSLYQLYGAELTAAGKPDAASSSFATIANRLSWFLDLRGPSMTVDTMCSSSLTALNLAMEAIQRGACEQALVGGVNLCAHPAKYIHLSRGSFASKDGKCRAFGADGTGYVPGEGVGVVLVKSLAAAEAAGDDILAVIKSCAINHGGNTHGYTVPNPTGQNAVIGDAIAASGVAPERVRYVETHGTGTALGDPIELEGLLRTYGKGDAPLRVGSVKSNIGHLEAAAGMAGLHKLVLQMNNHRLVPSLHADVPNPNIKWDTLNVEVQQSDEAFDLAEGDALGLSAFGAGGSNAHLILAPYFSERKRETPVSKPRTFVFSAATDGLLSRHLADVRDWLKGVEATVDLGDVASTLALHREHLGVRFAVVAQDRAALIEALQARLDAATVPSELPCAIENWVNGAALPTDAWVPRKHPVTMPPRPFDTKSFWLVDPCGPEGVVGRPTAARKTGMYQSKWVPLARVATSNTPLPDMILADTISLPLASELAERLGMSPDAVAVLDDVLTVDVDRVLVMTKADTSSKNLTNGFGWLLDRAQKRRRFDCLHVAIGGGASPVLQMVNLLPVEQRALTSHAIGISPQGATPQGISDIWTQFCAGAFPLCAPLRDIGAGVEMLEYGPVTKGQERPDPNGWHVITGGTGGIGLQLAQHLARQGVSRLVLTGRSPVPPRSDWDGLIAATDTDVGLRQKLTALRALPETTKIVQWDIEDTATLILELSSLSDSAPVSLITHLAGVVDDPTIAFVDKTDGQRETVFGAKFQGALSLIKALGDDSATRLLLVSSQSAVVPKLATGVLDYAMANAALNGLACECGPHVQSLMLPNWAGAGFGDADSPQMAALGLCPVNHAEGLSFFDRALESNGEVFLSAGLRDGFDLEQVLAAPERSTTNTNSTQPKPISVTPLAADNGLIDQMAAAFAPILDLDPAEWGPTERFGVLGVDSVLLTRMGRKLEEIVGAPIAADVMIANDTLHSLADWVNKTHGSVNTPEPKPAAPMPVIAKPDATSVENGIAIVGIGTVLPGAETVDEYWDNLLNGRDLVGEVPDDRWPLEGNYDPTGTNGSPSKWGSFVTDVAHFDATEFGLPASAAEATDPLVRLALWATRGALCDAGLTERELGGVRAGVFLGSRVANWADRLSDFHRDSVLGTAQNFIAAHICHWLDLNGPAVVIDTACSSSLYSTHLACASLRTGECDVAFAGGSEFLLDERPYQMLGRTGAMSPTGKCRTFDADANGFVPGEGAVTLVLKRLADAQEQGDRIYAVIEGSAVNNDGRTMGVTTPNPERQKEVIRQALANANASASEVGYVEAHGTGTALGDPMELRGLTEVFAETNGAAQTQFCGIGSVKSNIGHLLSTAGASGLAKVALSLHHKTLVGTLHCDTPNPRFAFDASPFFPVLQSQAFDPIGAWRRAGISGFGFGGTNVHIQLSDRHRAQPQTPSRVPHPVPARMGPYNWHPRPETPVPAQIPTPNLPSTSTGFQLTRTL